MADICRNIGTGFCLAYFNGKWKNRTKIIELLKKHGATVIYEASSKR